MIGLALGIRPRLLIADEPTTGLDVTIQAQILDLIQQTRAETGASILLITHDMGVIAETCQRVMVMFEGKLVEIAGVNDLFQHPIHPYTVRLLRATPGSAAAAVSAAPASSGIVELSVGTERLCASLDEVASDAPALALREVSPGHLVLCRPVAGDTSAPLEEAVGC
jgi:ABC-type dipeptide/oligopeptide/nickel transport system ATPase component